MYNVCFIIFICWCEVIIRWPECPKKKNSYQFASTVYSGWLVLSVRLYWRSVWSITNKQINFFFLLFFNIGFNDNFKTIRQELIQKFHLDTKRLLCWYEDVIYLHLLLHNSKNKESVIIYNQKALSTLEYIISFC